MSPHDSNALTRKAAKVLDSNLQITLQLQVTGRLVRNETAQNGMRLLVLHDFVLCHPFTRTTGFGDERALSEQSGKVAIRDAELWIAAGEHERIPYQGLTKDDKRRLGTLTAKDHSALLADQPVEEKAMVLKQLLASIPPDLRNQVMADASDSVTRPSNPPQDDTARE